MLITSLFVLNTSVMQSPPLLEPVDLRNKCRFHTRRPYWLILVTIFVFALTSEWILPSTLFSRGNYNQIDTCPDSFSTVNITSAGQPIDSRQTPPQTRIDLQIQPRPACTPTRSIVFAKTHKTAGSTVGSIIARYGYERNLSFALPKKGTIIGTKTFDLRMLPLTGIQERDGFHILFNHVPFHRARIRDVMRPEAKFITILREPVSHFYSAVSYFELITSLDDVTTVSSVVLKQLFRNITNCSRYRCRVTYNGQAFDLGVFRNGSTDHDHILKSLDKLENIFDLVLIREYFDESLLLLKKLMCWDFRDILYIPKKESKSSTPHYHSTKEQREMIRAWNFADVSIYEHFKKIIVDKIDKGGPLFQKDLYYFRQLNRYVSNFCTEISHTSQELPGFISNNAKEFCSNLERDVKPYTLLLQHVQRSKE